MTDADILYAIYILVLMLFCFLTGCLRVRKNWPLEYKLLLVLSGLTILVQALVTFWWWRGIESGWLNNIFLAVECGFILLIIYTASVHRDIKRLKGIFLMVLPIGIVLAYILNPMFIRFNIEAAFYYLFLILISACSSLIDALLPMAGIPFFRRPRFWMAFGLLGYSSLMTIIGAVGIFANTMAMQYYMPFSIIANTFMYGGFVASFVAQGREGRRYQ